MNETQNMQPVEAQPTPVATPSHGGFKLLLSIVGLVVVVGGFAAYTMFANPFVGKTPEQILAKAFETGFDDDVFEGIIEAGNISSDISVDISGTINDPEMPQPVTYAFNIPINMLYEEVTEEDYKLALQLKGLDLASVFTAVGLPVSEPQIIAAEARMFSVDKKGYIQVTQLPEFAQLFLGDTSTFMNKWFSFDMSDIEGASSSFDLTSLSEEQSEKAVDAFFTNLSETVSSDISMETVGSGREITYKAQTQELEAVFIQTAKDINDIVGEEMFVESELIPTYPEGDVTLIVMVERNLQISSIELQMNLNEDGVKTEGTLKFDHEGIFSVDMKATDRDQSMTTMHMDGSYKGKNGDTEQFEAKINVVDEVMNMDMRIFMDTEKYEGSRIEVPADATSLDEFGQL